jgi:putative CocE/NonD family hydrolase
MSVLSWIFSRVAKLDRPITRRVQVERGIRIPMADGTLTVANRYFPRNGEGLPVILIRTPYGLSRSKPYAEVFAQRGYQVVVQCCRGTSGSLGEWLPFQTDREDGLATIAWIRGQPWFGEKLGMFGQSYMGFVQWAVAADMPNEIGALALQIAASAPREMMFAGGPFALRTMAAWTHLVGSQAQGVGNLRYTIQHFLKVPKAYNQIPLSEVDRFELGQHFPFFQQMIESEYADAPLWRSMDFSDRVAEVKAPAHFLTGWFDIFLRGQLADYARLRDVGRAPRLMIGPWGHTSPGLLKPVFQESLHLFDSHLRELPTTGTEYSVRVFLMGAREWVDLPSWPPDTRPTTLHLQSNKSLTESALGDGPPDRYRFDPRDPTPDPGGNSDPGFGSHGNRKLEARSDVLTYTTEALPSDVDVMGTVVAELFVSSSLEATDFVARLCDVSPRGKSTNVCDGVLRLGMGNNYQRLTGPMKIEVEMWPTAYRFKEGHRIRLHVASGAHPRFARNLGSGEPIGSAMTFNVAEQEVFHDSDHPSAVILPVRPLQ